uniref:VWFA domain-containing protein n=1 Tax=Latimeria chalumnae TaxID=7897 RepID=H3A911_LATCH
GTEIAIVLDGSGSIAPEDFQRARDFISNIMKTFWKKCYSCEFAVVQYGEEIQTEFDLRESKDSYAVLEKVQNITQLGKVTKTASALQHVLDNIFTEEKGSNKDADKIIVVLTDGEIFRDPLNLTTVINSPAMANIERYAIGVGESFNKSNALLELQLISTDPDVNHLFRVDNYDALGGLLSMLEQNIVGIEGTQGAALQFELAQAGLSTQFLDDGNILIGALGAFDWSGGVIQHNVGQNQTRFFNESKGSDSDSKNSLQYSYLGYSVTGIKGHGEYLYGFGAPRHSLTGKVLVYQSKSHHLDDILEGEQVGSYFGSELCSLDIDNDHITDYLLVGAPYFHVHAEEGKVYIYRLSKQENSFNLAKSLQGEQKYIFARFGFAIASIGDINRDGYNDIVIGAPTEEDYTGTSGSIYLYNGCKDKDTILVFSQRISAHDIRSGIQYFGCSIDGGIDITDDDLADISVGSMGSVITLSSRPVVSFKVNVTFDPKEVPLLTQDSTQKSNADVEVKISLCFVPVSSFNIQQALRKSDVIYTMDLDIKKENKRVKFKGNEDSYSKTDKLRLVETQCDDILLLYLFLPVSLQSCTDDCYSGIRIHLRYSLSDPDDGKNHVAVLDRYSTHASEFELPYEKDCGEDNICIPNLNLVTELPQNFMLIIGDTREVTLPFSLTNTGEDAYMTMLELTYPQELQYRTMNKPKSEKFPSFDIQCTNSHLENTSLISMKCEVGHPVFKKSTMTNFSITWQVNSIKYRGTTGVIKVNI